MAKAKNSLLKVKKVEEKNTFLVLSYDPTYQYESKLMVDVCESIKDVKDSYSLSKADGLFPIVLDVSKYVDILKTRQKEDGFEVEVINPINSEYRYIE